MHCGTRTGNLERRLTRRSRVATRRYVCYEWNPRGAPNFLQNGTFVRLDITQLARSGRNKRGERDHGWKSAGRVSRRSAERVNRRKRRREFIQRHRAYGWRNQQDCLQRDAEYRVHDRDRRFLSLARRRRILAVDQVGFL